MADTDRANARPDRSLPVLPAVRADQHLFAGPALASLERDVLVPYLQRQRWFGGKARAPQAAAITDWAVIGSGSSAPTLAIVRVRYRAGPPDLYHVPTLVLAGTHAEQVLAARPETVLARLAHDELTLLCDAVMDDDACRTIFEATQRPVTVATHRGGSMVSRPSASPPAPEGDLNVVRFASTHSNSAVALGGRYLLKIFRRLETGLNPDIEIGRFLAAQHAPVRVPPLVGSLEHLGDGHAPTALVLTQRLVRSRTNGWDYALAALKDFFDRVPNGGGGRPSTAAAIAIAGAFLDDARVLGRRTAELHHALSSSDTDPDFTPVPATSEEVLALAEGLRRAIRDALGLLARLRSGLDAETARLAARVAALGPTLDARVAQYGSVLAPFVKIRVHGDYHLGQVLTLEHDFVILDFEGEPARPLAERRARQSPLRDVSGMLRSFSYAAHAALVTDADAGEDRRRTLGPWADAWIEAVSSAFLDGYLAAARRSTYVPADPAQVRALLDLFLIDKAVYELGYEMNNRPDWVHIPLRGLLALAAPPPPPRLAEAGHS